MRSFADTPLKNVSEPDADSRVKPSAARTWFGPLALIFDTVGSVPPGYAVTKPRPAVRTIVGGAMVVGGGLSQPDSQVLGDFFLQLVTAFAPAGDAIAK